MLKTVSALETAYANPGQRPGGVPTYVPRLDNVLGGLHRGAVTIVGGRPSTGKTSFIQSITRLSAKAGNKVVVCSLEDSEQSFWLRLLSQESGIDGTRLSQGKISPGEWTAVTLAAEAIAGLDIVVNDAIPRSHLRLMSWIERVGQGADLIGLDYIQLVRTTTRGNRNEQLTEVSNDLSAVVRSLDAACLVGSQLSRKADEEKPGLHHLRDCGALEADCDTAIILDDLRWCGGRPIGSGCTELPVTLARVAKNKHGRTGVALLKWTPELTMFEGADNELEQEYKKTCQADAAGSGRQKTQGRQGGLNLARFGL
jgi:replicative DNA helicase